MLSVYNWDTDSVVVEWAQNKKNGKGSYKLKSGEQYKGYFKNGMKEGSGKLKYATGETYEGEWKDDKRHGQGIMIDTHNKVTHDGLWVLGRFEKSNMLA